MKRKFLALLLAFVMVAGMLPMAALAETTPVADPVVSGYGFLWNAPTQGTELVEGGTVGNDWMKETMYVVVNATDSTNLWFQVTVGSDVWGCAASGKNKVTTYAFSFLNRGTQWELHPTIKGETFDYSGKSVTHATSYMKAGNVTLEVYTPATAITGEQADGAPSAETLGEPIFSNTFAITANTDVKTEVNAPSDISVTAANLTAVADAQPPAYGHADTYKVEETNKAISVTATGLEKTENAAQPSVTSYWVGVGLTKQEGATYAWGFGTKPLTPEYKTVDRTQTASNEEYTTLYWSQDTQAEWTSNKTGYISVKYANGVIVDYTVTFNVTVKDEGGDEPGTEVTLDAGYDWDWQAANSAVNTNLEKNPAISDCLDQVVWFKVTGVDGKYKVTIKSGSTNIVEVDEFAGKGGYLSLVNGGQNDGSTPPFVMPATGGTLTLEVTPAGGTMSSKQITVPAYGDKAPNLTLASVTGDGNKNKVTVTSDKTLKGQYFVGVYNEAGTLVAYQVTETDASNTDSAALKANTAITLTAAETVDFTTDTYTVKLTACPHNVESVPTEPLSGAPVLASAKMTGGAAVAEYSITVADTTNGTATVDKAKAEAGTEITVTATPASDAYELDTITVKDADDGNVAVTGNKFIMPAKNVTVTVTFKAKSTTPVTPPSGGGSTTTTPPVSTDKDSGTTSTTVKPSVKDETASVTVSDSTANALVNKTVKDKTDNAVIEVKPTGNKEVSEVKAEIPAKAVANLAEKTDASLTVATPVANVTISNDALADVSKDAKTVAVTAAAKTDETSGETTYEVAVLKDGEPVNDIKGEMKVSLPVDEKTAEAGKGLVAVLVDENGNETVITKSVMTEDGQMVMSLGTGTATIKYVDNSRDYDDEIPEWAADAVQFTSSRQLFLGVSEGDFGANETMNRAMLVTVLHRLEGEPTPTKEADFADVTSDSWYAASAAWSAEMGIVAGTENGFDGNRPITRQDLALMLYRYANVYGSGKGTSTDFTHMGGAEDVADYAAEAMSWAVGSGIIVGDENNNLDPQSPTTRAQVSVMLMRFVELLAAK